jgi:hypothetical protein
MRGLKESGLRQCTAFDSNQSASCVPLVEKVDFFNTVNWAVWQRSCAFRAFDPSGAQTQFYMRYSFYRIPGPGIVSNPNPGGFLLNKVHIIHGEHVLDVVLNAGVGGGNV